MADDAIGPKKADRAVSYAIAARGGPHGCNQAKGPNVACHKALAKADGYQIEAEGRFAGS